MLELRLKALLQKAIIAIARPYVYRELPGWGVVYRILVGSYERDWFWTGALKTTMRGKLHGYIQHFDLSGWPNRANYFLGRWYDLELQLLIMDLLQPGDTVVDVGAHVGDFSLLASRLVGASGKVICFEPNPICIKKLELEIRTNEIANIVLHPVGLGTRDDELEQDPFSNTLYPEFKNGFKVKVKKGDDLLRNQNPDFIKMDVEGFECNALNGMSQTISRCHPVIVTEISEVNLAECHSSISELVSILQNAGYQGYKLGLRKDQRGYVWTAVRLHFEGKHDSDDYDAVWVHPLSKKRFIFDQNFMASPARG